MSLRRLEMACWSDLERCDVQCSPCGQHAAVLLDTSSNTPLDCALASAELCHELYSTFAAVVDDKPSHLRFVLFPCSE